MVHAVAQTTKMVLHDIAISIINGTVPASADDKVEAYQFATDNGYLEELTIPQIFILRDLIEMGKIRTPVYKP